MLNVIDDLVIENKCSDDGFANARSREFLIERERMIKNAKGNWQKSMGNSFFYSSLEKLASFHFHYIYISKKGGLPIL